MHFFEGDNVDTDQQTVLFSAADFVILRRYYSREKLPPSDDLRERNFIE